MCLQFKHHHDITGIMLNAPPPPQCCPMYIKNNMVSIQSNIQYNVTTIFKIAATNRDEVSVRLNELCAVGSPSGCGTR